MFGSKMFFYRFMILLFLFALNSFAKCDPDSYVSPPGEESFLEEAEEAEEEGGDDYDVRTYRLPPHTKPLSYDLKICPFLEKDFIFTGEVLIRVLVVEPTNSIVLNSYGLNITKVMITNNNDTYSPAIELRRESQMLILNTSSTLIAQENYDVKIAFQGRLKSDLKGFYRSSYKSEGARRWLATTQFEATSARRAFPCYDEPEFKTPFRITIGRLPQYTALSNMKLKSTSEPDPTVGNRVWDTFEQTPPMPTYLVAFIVADFKRISTADNSFSVWTKENTLADATYAFTEGQKLLKAMENYTGIKYYLEKMDNAAIPDFEYGAMENWGLVTYRESYVLCNENALDKNQCSEKEKETVFTVIAHELAHQWFGNYVTMTWWGSLWLNEGFATYFQYHLAHEVEPKWRLNEFFVIDVCQKSLFNEGVYSTRSMTSKVITPYDIVDKLEDSTVTDSKSGCVIRMLENVVSTPLFKKALNTHLTKGFSAGGSVTPDHLWAAFDEVMRQNSISIPFNNSVASVMKGWSENPLYPLITVQRIPNGNYSNINVTQTQYDSTRFYSRVSSEHSWIVPLTFTKKFAPDFNNTQPTLWLFPEKKLLLENEVEDQEWIIFNIQQSGYYRVNYDIENWKLLIKQLKTSPQIFHPLNRAQLIDDAVILAIDGKLPFDIAFSLLEYLPGESDMIPLFAGLQNINSLYNEWSAYEARPDLEGFLSPLVGSMYKKVEHNENNLEEEHLSKTFREDLLKVACRYNLPACVSRAKTQFSTTRRAFSNKKESPVVKQDVVCTMLQSNISKTVWNELWDWLRETNNTFRKPAVLSTLGCVTNEELLKEYLNKLLDENDKDGVFVYVKTILRSVFSTHEGVTAGLKVAEDVLPRFNELSDDPRRNFLRMLWHLKWKVRRAEHLALVKTLILQAEKLENAKYKTKIATILNDAQVNASKNIELNKNLMEYISAGLKKNEQSKTR